MIMGMKMHEKCVALDKYDSRRLWVSAEPRQNESHAHSSARATIISKRHGGRHRFIDSKAS